ncbi:MAG: UvrD-helicase domain-containing protein [Candidatus Spyradocola sp.]|jgi:ATP-dependent helicase/nuclease subunit A
MPEFTPEQKRVIAHEKGDLLVSAAAGSGKTAVLVERILHLVRGGADIASFLVVTFTRAAADELRERLLLRLEREAEETPALRAQLDRVPLASISTIHAFCRTLLSRYSEKAGVEPNLRVCSEAERVIFQMRAMDDVLDAAYEDEDLLLRLERMGGVQQVRLNVESLYRFLLCQPEPMEWLREKEEAYARDARDPAHAPWMEAARAEGERALSRVQAQMEAALRFVQASCSEDCRKMEGLIAGDVAGLVQMRKGEASDVSFATFRSPNRRKADDSPDLTRLRALRDAYKAAFAQAKTACPVLDDWEEQKIREMTDTVHALAEITRRFHAEYGRIKADMGVVDYNDLEQMALRLTEDEGVCEDLRLRYAYVFVDEFQDSSAVQEVLLRRVARGNNTFHVGDVKQSIYGFRQSDPGLFLDEQRRYGRGEGGELIALNRNFRSLPNVLYSVNRVFSRCMTQESAGMDYDADAALYPGRTQEGLGAPTLVQLIDRKGMDDEGEGSVRTEAEAVAHLIRQLLGTPVSDGKGGTRPARYGDIVVLRRAVSSVLPQYMECFARMGIPAYAGGGGSFFETPEIREALDCLWAVHNPLEDVHLLGALHGVGRFTAQELAEICLKGRSAGEGRRVYTNLIAYRNDPDDPVLGEKIGRFLDQIAKLRRVAREEKLAVLCAAVLEETGILARFAALPRGQARVGNLRSLPTRAAEYDEAGLRLGDFLRRIESTAGRNREEDVPAFSENDDVVRIMTVHKSKGLQFPIVIGAGLGARFRFSNDRDADGYLTSRVYCHRDYGLALEYYDPESAAGDDTIPTRTIGAVKRRESLAEEMRILYVLMTRAQDRLALVGEVAGLEKRLQAWAAGGQDPACPLDYLLPSVLSHPDARALRSAFGLEMAEEADPSRWEVRWSLRAQEADASEEAPDLGDLLRAEPDEDVLQQLTYRYPYPEPAVRQKQSVTELAHGEETFFVREKPAFLTREKRLQGAARGSALHRFMEIVDFAAFAALPQESWPQEIARQAGLAAESARMAAEEAEAVQSGAEEVLRFLRSRIGQKILCGAPILREKPFELRLDEDGQTRLVQGVIDLMVLEADGATLVDYKTDHTGLDPESVRQRHGAQVRLYREAARRAGLSVKESLVYLFFTGEAVAVE